MTKAIQFTIDEALLRQVDRDPEVKRAGRSAFLRAAIRDYLGRRREGAIAAAYRRGYGQTPVTADEFGPLMRNHYDFSKARPNPYAARLKTQVTARGQSSNARHSPKAPRSPGR